MRKVLTNVFNPISESECEYLPETVVSIADGLIHSLQPRSEVKLPYEDYSDHLMLPGFIDLHTHLPQYRIRGNYQPALLPWLEKTVFPEEARFRDLAYTETVCRQFFQALYKAGTTFSVVYLPPFYEASELAFQLAKELGVQALMGMTLMDMNSPEDILQSTDYALTYSQQLKEKYQGENLGYIYSPRFALTCSRELCREISSLAQKEGTFIQSHLSENTQEIALVKEIFGAESYTAHYESLGLLRPRSIMGHAIHLSNQEIAILKRTGSKIAHCPESNFYLKSGEFPYARIREAGVDFGLASDIGAAPQLGMLQQAKMMNYRQSLQAILPEELLYRITLGNARILGRESALGSIEAGKQADLLLYKVPPGFEIGYHSLGQLIFADQDFNLSQLLVKGEARAL